MIPTAKPGLGNEELMAVKEVLESGTIVQGPKVAEFEEKFGKYIGVKNAVAVNSGSSALHLALLANGVKKGQEVLIPPLTFFSTGSAVLMCGALPAFSDIERDTYTIDPIDVKKAVCRKTSAIVPVHLYGQTADMEPLLDTADENNLAVIEDAAQAHGATYHGRKAGALGHTACFSFYASKIMTTGEGGMVVTNDDEIARKCRLLRDHGQLSKYEHIALGYNYRMSELAAAIGLVQLKKLDKFVAERRRNASILTKGLSGIENLTPPVEGSGRRHSYYQYILRLEDGFPHSRDRMIRLLEDRGIASRPSYPKPLYRQEALRGRVKPRKCKVTESVIPKLLEIPVHPFVPEEALRTMIETFRSVSHHSL